MKKIFTISLASFFILIISFNLFAQSNSQQNCIPCNDKEYANKKTQFWNEYKNYKNNLDHNIVTQKPEDPNGIFYIDENNNFSMKPQGTPNTNWSIIPQIRGSQRDLASGYSFSQSTTTYTPATGGTVLCTYSTFCDDSYFPATIPFTFMFNGLPFTSVAVQCNGYLQLGGTSPGGYNPICAGSYPNVLVPFARDLLGNNALDSLRYITLGSAPNRVFVVEWWHWGIYSGGTNELDFQIQLYETSNVIKFVYKPETPVTSVTDVQVGIMGATNADFLTRTTTTNWSATTAGTACSYNTFNSSVYPANGLTFTWTPPSTGPMGYQSSNTVQLNANVPIAQSSINNQIVQVQVADTGLTSPLIINRLRFQTLGSNNPGTDIAAAKLWYTRSVNTFSMTRQFGSTVTSPNGVFNFQGDTASLDPNATNYFWLTYDISAGAVLLDSVDAQCDSIFGSSPMNGVVPTTVAPFGSSPIDNYCRGTVTNAGCPYDLYVNNVSIGSINNTSGCNSVMPYVYNNFTGLSTVVRQNNSYVMTASNQLSGNINPCNFATWVDWNNNNSFGDAGEYFLSTTIVANSTIPSSTNIIVPAGATIGNHRMRIRANLAGSSIPATYYCTNLSYGEQEDYTFIVRADTNMTYVSSTTTQSSVAPIYTPSTNTQIIGIQVATDGTISPIGATSFTLNTTGTSRPAQDLTNAKIYWTGTNPNFSTTTLFGVQAAPNGTFSITGTQQLAQGLNYFWMTYDIPLSAPTGDTIDAQCTSVTIGGVPRTPTVTNPAGFRIISGSSLCGTYTIPGSYPTIAAAITDLNSKGTPLCNVIYNVAAGYTETAANLTITTSGTPTASITFRKFGTGANPKIRAAAGTGSYDGIIKLYGVNYITFDGIDVSDTSTNTTTTTQMEWGYAMLRPDGAHGNQYNTIKNCNITLNKTNAASYGIYSSTINLTGSAQTPTSSLGTNSYNNFLSNNISNCFSGMYINSYTDGTFPFSLGDHNNTVSNSPSGPNTISNFGGTATTAYGIYSYYQSGFTCTNTSINSRGGINSTGYLYGIYNYHYYDNGDATLSGDTISLADTTGSTGYLYGIYNYGYYGNNDIITNNVIQNFVNPCSGYYNYYIYNYCASGSPLYRNNITITGNKIINNTVGLASTGYGYDYHIYNYGYVNNSINISNNLDSNNQNVGTSGYTPYLIYNPGTANNMVINNNRVVNNIFGGLSAGSTSYGFYLLGTSFLSCQIDSNTFANNSLPSTGAHSMYFMYISCISPNMDVSYNNVSGNTGAGSGSFYSMYYSATPAYASIENVSNNTITNQSKTTATGTGAIYGLYKSGSSPGTVNVNNNTVTGFSSAAATSFYGIYQIGSPPNILNMNNNKIGNFTTLGAGTIYGLYNNPTSTTIPVISNDSIFNLNSTGGSIYGMYAINGNPVTISKNKIQGINTTSGTVYGLYIGGGTINYVYNNFISDLNTTTSTTYATPAATGLYIAGGTYDYVYYNTIYMKDSSTSATSFGTAGIYASTAYNVDLRNNVVCNYSYPGPTLGNTVAYWRSANSLPTYLSSSNNNCFYSGTPAANRLIFYDGTNSIQTLAAYKTFVLPRDNNSATELPPFVNIASKPYDLRVLTNTGTQLESGGQIISTTALPPALINITQDAYGTARFPNSGYPVGTYTPTAPDMGAYEFGGVNADLVPPFISYTPLGIGGTSNRAFNNVVITDASGVNTTTFRPRCYYKRSTDSNVVNGTNTSADDGWKYVVSNGTTSPFDFTIDYSKLVGGTGVANGNIIQYFVIAQDNAGTPNVGSNQATFTTAPTSDSLISTNAPITSTLTYTIGANTFSGVIPVGTAQTYTSLTGATGIFAALNAGTLTGDVQIQITSDLVEDGTNGLNLQNESGPGRYKITIVPATASLKTIQGSVAQAMIRLNGVRRVTIDGNNGLGAKYLTFRNYYGSTPTLQFQNETGLDTIKNCTLESNNIGTASGTIYFSTTTNALGFGNDSICINSCDIRDRSDIAGTPCNAIYALGTTTTLNTYNNWVSIINNNIYNNFYDAGVFSCGIYMNSGNSNWTISGNSFYQTTARSVPANSSSFLGIYLVSSLTNDVIISNNYFGGSAPLCGSSPLTISGAGAFTYYAMYLANGYLAPVSVQGNTIQNFALTYTGASTMNFFRAVYVAGSTSWVNIGNISGNTIGSGTGNNSILLTINTTTSTFTIPMIQDFGFGTIMNNTIGSITYAGNATSTGGDLYAAIYWSNTQAGQIYTISNNLIGSLTTPNSIQMTNLVNYHTFRGAYVVNGAGTINNFTNNIVANITSLGTTALYLDNIYGYWYATAVAGIVNVTGNTIRNLTNNTNVASASFGLAGILCSGYGVNTITNNNVYSLYSYGTTGAELVGGISAGGYNGGTVAFNKIYDLRETGTGVLAPAPLLLGINTQSYGLYTVTNNMISLTNGDASLNSPAPDPNERFEQVVVKNPPVNLAAIPKDGKVAETKSNITATSWGAFDGTIPQNNKWSALNNNRSQDNIKKNNDIKKEGPNSTVSCAIAGVYHTSNNFRGPCNYYYNTIYIGGSSPGSLNSWNFIRTANSQVSILDNLFINNRTGGNNYCVSNEGSLTEGWGFKACNYNAYLNSNDATIGEWGLGNAYPIASWIATSNGDYQSWESNTTNINPLNLVNSISSCDLRIVSGNSSAWLVSGKGIAIPGQGTDYEGTVRSTSISTGTTDIGADEFVATPPGNPVATQVGTPGAGASTSYVLYGRTICTINWGAGGTSYPTNMTLNYYSGINPPNANSLAPTYSNSYWTLAATGNLTGASYDITFYYGDNETYTINSPVTNCILSNRNVAFWQAFPYGPNALQSNLNSTTNVFNILGQNMISFSQYALTDGSVVPALITPVHNAVNQLTTDTLTWSAVTGATAYRVQLSTDSLFGTTVIDDSTVTTPSRIVTGLASNTRYFWRVRAKVPAIVSPFAAGYKFTTAVGVAYLGLKVIPGGFYNSSMGQLNLKDTVRVLLVDGSCNKVDSSKAIIDSVTFSATSSMAFSNAQTGNYYIFVYHRNHITISSANTVAITRGLTVNYDFTVDSSKTYGMNVTKVSTAPVLWGMLPGDANQDGYVDGLDQTIWVAQNGLNGWFSADFNGDTYVDGLDQTLWVLFNGSSSNLPCNFTTVSPGVHQTKVIPGNFNKTNVFWNVLPQNNTTKNEINKQKNINK